MRKSALLALLLCAPAAAFAQAGVPTGPGPGAPGHWSLYTGETMAPGHDVVSAEFGYPGISFGYAHGLSDHADFGAKFDINYGLYYTSHTQLGLGFRFPLRLVAARRDRMSLLLHIDPGLFVNPKNDHYATQFGFQFPIGATLGFAVTPELRLGLGFELPMMVNVVNNAAFVLGPLFGFGAEFFVDKQLSVGLNLKFGPMFSSAGGDAEFGSMAQVGIGWRM